MNFAKKIYAENSLHTKIKQNAIKNQLLGADKSPHKVIYIFICETLEVCLSGESINPNELD